MLQLTVKIQEGYGREWENTFRTIRHACEWIEDNFNPLVPQRLQLRQVISMK